MRDKNLIFCHRGLYGCTDVNQEFLKRPYAKGELLSQLPPENSYTSIKAAFDLGYNVELDVCMTKDNFLIVTHTNHLPVHVKNALDTDYVSTKTFEEIAQLKTGIGGKTEPFLTYEKFLDLFQSYPNALVNIEIKGTLEPKDALPPQEHPSIVEQLIKITPEKMYDRIIWSSFSTEMIAELKKFVPQAKVAQLFCEFKEDEPYIFKNRSDRYLQFTHENIKSIDERLSLEAAHIEISTLDDNEALAYCVCHGIHIRTWTLLERNPEKDSDAKQNICKVFYLKKKYPTLSFDIITDYAPVVEKMILFSLKTDIRLATADDAYNIKKIHVETYQKSYRGYVPDEYLDSLSLDDEVIERTRKYLEITECWLAVYDGEPVAFAYVTYPEDGVFEINALYVHPNYQKCGIGLMLVDYLCREKKKINLIKCMVWTMKFGPSLAFYEKAGFAATNEEKVWKFDIPIIKLEKKL